MTADEIRAAVEAGRKCVDGLKQAISQTGEVYIAVSVGGVLVEGKAPPFATTAGAAAEGLLQSLLAYASEADSDHSGTLYWRVHPEIDVSTHGVDPVTLERVNYPEPRYYGYARLLISSKRVVPEIVEAYNECLAEREAGAWLKPGEERVLCESDSVSRTITFHVRPGFGDGRDQAGLSMPIGWEREAAIRQFTKALDGLVAGREPMTVWTVREAEKARAA